MGEVQARPQLESTARFQSLIVKKDNGVFNLNLVDELVPLQHGLPREHRSSWSHPTRTATRRVRREGAQHTQPQPFVARVTRTRESDSSLIRITCPCNSVWMNVRATRRENLPQTI